MVPVAARKEPTEGEKERERTNQVKEEEEKEEEEESIQSQKRWKEKGEKIDTRAERFQ